MSLAYETKLGPLQSNPQYPSWDSNPDPPGLNRFALPIGVERRDPRAAITLSLDEIVRSHLSP